MLAFLKKMSNFLQKRLDIFCKNCYNIKVKKKQKNIYKLQMIGMLIWVTLLSAALIFYVPTKPAQTPPESVSEVIAEPVKLEKTEPPPIILASGTTDPNKVVEHAFVPAPIDMQRKVYLTFDDGPSPVTPQILEILAKRNVKATFFVIKHTSPSVTPGYKQITDAGHTIALHSASHAYKSLYATVDTWWTDFEDIRNHVKEHTGVDTRLFRFPGGASNTIWNFQTRNQIIADVNRRGDIYFDWNVSSGDANKKGGPPSDVMAANVVRDIEKLKDPRAVVLFHDGITKQNTVNALPKIIDTLKAKGYVFDTCDNLISHPVHHRLKH